MRAKSFYVLVKRWEKKRQPDESTPIAGAGQRWWHKSATFDPIEEDLTATWPEGNEEEPQPTLLDATVEDADGDDNMNGNKREKGEEKPADGASQPKKKAKQVAQNLLNRIWIRIAGGMQGPDSGSRRTTVIDTGGKGNCGWRSLSFALAGLNSAISDEALVDKLEPLAKTLQVRVTTYLIQQKKHWQDSWAPDPKTNQVMEDGSVPATVAEYCEAVKRPNRWVDGLLLATAAILQQVNIIVWTKKNGEWSKIAILKSGPDWRKCQTIPLILSRGHFMTLRHQKGQWPKEWVSEAGEDTPCSQGIDTQLTELNPILGRGGLMATPLSKVRKSSFLDDEEIENMLRPCSMSRSSKPLKSCQSRTSSRKSKQSLQLEHLLRTCSPCESSVASSCKKQQVIGGGKKRVRSPNERIIVNGSRKEWKCPHCDEILDLTKGDSIDYRAVGRHLRQKHSALLEKDKKANEKLGRSRTSLGLRQLTWPVEFVKMKKEDIQINAQFVCPFCAWCLPKFPSDMAYPKYRYLMKVSKLNHIKNCKKIEKPLSLRQFNSAENLRWYLPRILVPLSSSVETKELRS